MTYLKEGEKAPAFTGRDQNGNKISLSDYKGRKVILYIYSEAGSPTCTIESCNLRDNYALLKKNGFEIIGISPDDEKKQKKFEIKYGLPFPLIADTTQEVLAKYGVLGEKEMFGRKYMGVFRTTFVIDEKGTIRKIFLRPKNKQHAEEIINAWKEVK
jgi:peroxiredoxin Q/BCP